MPGQVKPSVRVAAAAARRAMDSATSVKSAVAAYREPRARLIRARKRARIAFTVRAVVAVAMIVVVWHLFTLQDQIAGAAFGVIAAAALVVTVGSGRRAWKLERTPLPQPAPPLPPSGSIARPHVDRLAARQQALKKLLPSLGEAAEDTAVEADRAAIALRRYAARLAAVEAARAATGSTDARELDQAVASLSARLESGVAAYERLVRAAAEAVAASGSGRPDPMAMRQLEDATDRVAGLAKGLREVGKLPGV